VLLLYCSLERHTHLVLRQLHTFNSAGLREHLNTEQSASNNGETTGRQPLQCCSWSSQTTQTLARVVSNTAVVASASRRSYRQAIDDFEA
jgi:hypothetical protein